MVRRLILQTIDSFWVDHLESMNYLRNSVNLRAYGQRDPLIEYKSEGYELFLDMMTNIRRNVVFGLFQFQPQVAPQVQPIETTIEMA